MTFSLAFVGTSFTSLCSLQLRVKFTKIIAYVASKPAQKRQKNLNY